MGEDARGTPQGPTSPSSVYRQLRFVKKTPNLRGTPTPQVPSSDIYDRSIDSDRGEPASIFARKSMTSAAQGSPTPSDNFPPILRTKGIRTSNNKSASSTRPNAVAGPSGHRPSNPNYIPLHTKSSGIPVDTLDGSQREDTVGARRKTSFPMPTPQSHHRTRPARKTLTPQQLSGGSPYTARRRSMMTPSVPEPFPAKSTSIVPFWQTSDDDLVKERGNTRRPNYEERNFAQRVAMASSGRRIPAAQLLMEPPPRENDHPKSYLGRNMKLRQEGEPEDDSDSLIDVDHPAPRFLPVRQKKTSSFQQLGPKKAARKLEWPPRPLFELDSDDESNESMPKSSSEPEDEEEDEVDQLESDEDDIGIEEIIAAARRSFSPSEIEILPGPPDTANASAISSTPSREMLKAIEALSLASVRMQRSKKLPFLLRNLRTGFISRCQQLKISVERAPGPVNINVRYEYELKTEKSHVAESRVHDWVCPLCELHGSFATRAMLGSHLKWDHDDVLVKWSLKGSGMWLLNLTITDPLPEEESRDSPQAVDNVIRTITPLPDPTPLAANISSPFPFVALSSPEPRLTDTTPTPVDTRGPQFILSSAKLLRASPNPSVPPSREYSTTATSSATRPPSSARGRSTTAATTATTETTTTTTTATVTSATLRSPRPTRYPTPPPRNNPLGPAAQAPYLPAKSEYGGPDVYYSCRPGGACIYDLLNTLPLEPFGVLAWDILDREDEIFDSDNVKDEYKVMHALWGRWIVLNRNTFIRDYYKGTVAFVDYYWRMIHRAAGWDALRYWLLMLVANRFVTGSEVAKILKHYEGLTGMDIWYD